MDVSFGQVGFGLLGGAGPIGESLSGLRGGATQRDRARVGRQALLQVALVPAWRECQILTEWFRFNGGWQLGTGNGQANQLWLELWLRRE